MQKHDVITSTASFFPEEANQQIDSIDFGAPPVLTGSAGYTGGTANPVLSQSSTEPPITNRGALMTIPSENRSLLDWVAFTFKRNDPYQVAEIIGLSSSLFSLSPRGFSGYRKSLRFGNISIYYDGREEMGCHVEMSGQGCRQYEANFTNTPWKELFGVVLSEGGKFSRLDLAIDNVDGVLSLELVYAAIQDHGNQVRTLFGEWRRIQKGSFQAGAGIIGETIYLGSTKSQVMFRIYNKAQESGIDGQWVRFEIQLRDKRAQEAAKLFTSEHSIGTLATGIINNYFSVIDNDDSNISRCALQSWWSAWLQSTDKLKLTTEKAIKYVSDTMDFLKRQYAPSIAMIERHLGAVTFNSFVNEVLEDGHLRMGAKHEQILTASSNGKAKKGDKQ